MLDLIASLMSKANKDLPISSWANKKEMCLFRMKRGRGKRKGWEEEGERGRTGEGREGEREWGGRRESRLRNKGLENQCDSNMGAKPLLYL